MQNCARKCGILLNNKDNEIASNAITEGTGIPCPRVWACMIVFKRP